MEYLKTLFGDGALTLADFESALKEHPEIKLANLADGGYVSKKKYDDDLGAKDTNIKTLTDTIGERDKSLADLKKKLESAGTDEQLLTDLRGKLDELQEKAKTDKDNFDKAIKKERYKSACKEFANDLKFTSKAAKRAFVNELIAKDFELSGDKIIGASDYLEQYKADNEDSFESDKPPVDTDPEPPVPPVDRRKPNPPAPKISLTERMKMANAKK